MALRLLLTGAFGLLLTAALLVGLSATAVRQQRDEEGAGQAQRVAEGLARRIGNALEAGVPLEALEGTDAIFRRQLAEVPEIDALTLVDRHGRVLQETRRDPKAGPSPDTVQSVAPVVRQGMPVADVRVHRSPSGGLGLRAEGLAPMGLAILAGVLIAYEIARRAGAAGPQQRRRALKRLADAVNAGRRDAIVTAVATPGHDPALVALLADLRSAHEERARLQRWVASLRATEPDRARREQLDALADRIDGGERFAEGELAGLPEAGAGWADAEFADALAAIALGAGLTVLARWALVEGGVKAVVPSSALALMALSMVPALIGALLASLVAIRQPAALASAAPVAAGGLTAGTAHGASGAARQPAAHVAVAAQSASAASAALDAAGLARRPVAPAAARGLLAGAALGAAVAAAGLNGLGAALGFMVVAVLLAAIARQRS